MLILILHDVNSPYHHCCPINDCRNVLQKKKTKPKTSISDPTHSVFPLKATASSRSTRSEDVYWHYIIRLDSFALKLDFFFHSFSNRLKINVLKLTLWIDLDGGSIISRPSPLPCRHWTSRNAARRTRGAGCTWYGFWDTSVKVIWMHYPYNFGGRKSKVLPRFLVSSGSCPAFFRVRCTLFFFIVGLTFLYGFNDEVKPRFVAVRHFLGAHFATFVHWQIPSFSIRVWMTCTKDAEKVFTKKLTKHAFLSLGFLCMEKRRYADNGLSTAPTKVNFHNAATVVSL